MSGMNAVSIDAALDQGFTTRPTQETVRDTLEWYRSQPSDKNWPAGISRELEAQVLEHLRE
jgi:2'-hydroxyisoflavone reductase